LTSTTNNLYIEFRSDADTAGTGFKATYTTGICKDVIGRWEGEGGGHGHGSWIGNYLCNQCLSPLILWV